MKTVPAMIGRVVAAVLLCNAGVVLALAGMLGDTSRDLGIRAADPSVIRTDDGYVAVESRSGRALFVRVAPSLEELASAKPVRIWADRERLGEVWAPEIVFNDERYEIYFTAGVGSDHRMYVVTSDHAASDYGEAKEIDLPDDKWAIDGLPVTFGSEDYFVWSGWQGDTDVRQDIFIAALGADGKALSPRVAIATPDKRWENVAGESPAINEGPQPILDPAGQLHIVYSANGSWGENYCLADLRLRAHADPLDPANWSESNGCLFGANEATLAPGATLAEEAKGVGHHSFVLPHGDVAAGPSDGKAEVFLYHGVPAEEDPSDFWAARKWYVGAYQWVPNVSYGTGDHSDLGWSIKFIE